MTKPIKYLRLTGEDVSGRYWVECSIIPKLPQDDMLRMQQAQAFRAPGPDGAPMMADEDIARYVLKHSHPEEIVSRAKMQALVAADQEIMQIRQTALRDEWKNTHTEIVKAYEKAMNPDPDKEFEKLKKTLTPEKFRALMEMVAMQERAKLANVDPAQMMSALQAQAGQQEAVQAQAARVPETVMPYQEARPSPEVAPTQMGLTAAPQPMAAEPDMLAMQAGRAFNPPR